MISPYFSRYNANIDAGAKFSSLTGTVNGWNASEDGQTSIVSAYGSFINLRVDLTVAPGAGQSRTFTLRVNGSDTALTVTISETNTSATDTTHSVAVSPGDTVSFTQTDTGSAASTIPITAVEFDGTNTNEALMLSATTALDTALRYIGPFWGGLTVNATEANVRGLVSAPGVISKLYVGLGAAPGGSDSRIFTLLKNGSATSLTVTISSSTTTGSDTSNSVSVSAGDLLSIKCDVGTTPAASSAAFGMMFSPTTDGESNVVWSSTSSPFPLGTQYARPAYGTGSSWSIADAIVRQYGSVTSGVLKNMYFNGTTAPGAGNSYTYRSRVAGGYGNLSVLISGASAVSGSDTSNSDTISNGTSFNTSATPASSPTAPGVQQIAYTWFVQPPATTTSTSSSISTSSTSSSTSQSTSTSSTSRSTSTSLSSSTSSTSSSISLSFSTSSTSRSTSTSSTSFSTSTSTTIMAPGYQPLVTASPPVSPVTGLTVPRHSTTVTYRFTRFTLSNTRVRSK